MSRTLRTAAVAGALLLCSAVSALAESGKLTLVLGGEAYDGPPRFEVSFNGKKLGEGTVDRAIDTSSTGRFAEAKSKSALLQSFEFAIPAEAFSPSGFVRVHFLNEANGGPGSPHDRNLYIFSVAVNGQAVPARELTTVASQGLVPSPMLGEYLALLDETTLAVAAAPASGWPAASADTAAPPAVINETAAETLAAAPAVTAEGVIKPEVKGPATAAPAPPSQPEPPAAPATEVASVEQASGAAADAATAGGGACALDQIYNVIGFNENSNDLTPKLEKRLDDILKDIGENECKVQVVGYSSTVGNNATSALFAVERAQNVLAYLRANGLKMAKATAAGGGATEQFGADPLKNRRVVITVTP